MRRKKFPVEGPKDILGMTMRMIDEGVSVEEAIQKAHEIRDEYEQAQKANKPCWTLTKRGHFTETTDDPNRVKELQRRGWKLV